MTLELRRVTDKLALAQNPLAAAEDLALLATEKNERILKALAQHPNTPSDVVEQLAARYPLEAAHNPSVPSHVLLQLVQHTGTQANKIRLAAAHSAQLTSEIGLLLAADANKSIRLALAENRAAQSSVRSVVLEKLAKDIHAPVRQAALHNPALSLPAMLTLAAEFPQSVDDAHPLLDMLCQNAALLGQVPANVRLHVAQHSQRDDVLSVLSKSPHVDTRALVAANPAISLSLRLALLGDVAVKVRTHAYTSGQAAGEIPNEVVFFYQQLGSSADFSKRVDVDVVLCMLTDADLSRAATGPVWMQCLLAEHPLIPAVLLEKLSLSSHSEVREAVARNVAAPLSVLENCFAVETHGVRLALAQHPHASTSMLEKLATDMLSPVRACVAANPRAPIALLEKLATDKMAEVRIAVAKQSHTTAALLTKLSKDVIEDIRAAVVGNPHVPMSIAIKLAGLLPDKFLSNPALPLWLLENPRLFDEMTPEARASLVSHTLDADMLGHFSRHTDAGTRAAAASNPHLPLVLLEQLLGDEVSMVRKAARKNTQLPHLWVRRYQRLGSAEDFTHRESPDEHISPKELDQCSVGPFWQRFLVAQHPRTPLLTLEKLVHDVHPEIQRAATGTLMRLRRV